MQVGADSDFDVSNSITFPYSIYMNQMKSWFKPLSPNSRTSRNANELQTLLDELFIINSSIILKK